MASAKRKQDEKNLKTLRELVSQPGNKECFDCRQRGPTYVNMTIGSYVCMSCSGLLRGLTPPHRVKSISMATFNLDDINFLKERGNEYCRSTWLALQPHNDFTYADTKDEQKMKEMMIERYEMKRYYISPSEVSKKTTTTTTAAITKTQSKESNNSSLTRIPNSESPQATSTPNSTLINNETSKSNNSFGSADFVADFSKVPDPYLPATPTNYNNQPIISQPSFANFDNNPIFNSSKGTGSMNQTAGCLSPNFNGISSPPSEDRYAALKDLDCLMKQAQIKEENPPVGSTTWNTNNSNLSNSIWGGYNNQGSQVISNPFTANDLWRPSNNLINNNVQISDNTLNNSANPFRQIQFSVNNGSAFDTLWASKESRNNEDVIPSSQLMTSFPNKTWQPPVAAYHANPFVVGSGIGDMTRNSNNPFL